VLQQHVTAIPPPLHAHCLATAQVARRPSTGLQFDRWTPNGRIIRYKLLGFHAILAAIAFFYYVTHEYSKDLYVLWFLMLRTIGPFAWVAAIANFCLVDGYQTEAAKKEDMYHNLGRVIMGQGTAVPIPAAKWHNMAREYLVKVFFLPLMASFYSNSLQTFERLVSDRGFACAWWLAGGACAW
jgi:hypothetical protein